MARDRREAGWAGCGCWLGLLVALAGVVLVVGVALLPVVGVWWVLLLVVSLSALVPFVSLGLARWVSQCWEE